jgi:hypothetical protein
MTETQITYRSEGVDSLGTPTATVGVSRGDLIATHTSFSRGGCLAAGTVYLRNVRTGRRHEVDLTSWASDSEAHATYLIGLAERHVGGAT